MGLFGFGKKKEEADKKFRGEITSIKVLGSGCKNCHILFENVSEVMKRYNPKVEVEYITDMEKVTAYGVMSMPALVVNEKVVSMGKVLKVSEVEAMFGN